MCDLDRIGRHIAALRKAKGFTGEKIAEILGVSPQAVSKWENGKCLPDTSILPSLAKTLECSIDSILIPKELQILSAEYGDGAVSFDVTRFLDGFVNNNKLNVIINRQLFGHDFENDRIHVLTLKYQTPSGVFFSYVLDNNPLSLDSDTKGFISESPYKILGAFYGNRNNYFDVMYKLKHYDYFKQKEIYANHESFPSSISCDTSEYLTIVYVNHDGIHTVSCTEGEKLCFSSDMTRLYANTGSGADHILPGIMQLNWGEGIDCTWAGALYAALKYMGDDVSYEYIMGASAACFRIAFAPVWDYSSVDALVVFNYAEIAYKALGYELIRADRVGKEERNVERRRIVNDIKAGKPPIAINLRIAPEWGVITGYLENGNELTCSTYFDKAVFDGRKDSPEFVEDMKKTKGYLYVDHWPFAIAHFGEKIEKPSGKQVLLSSLKAKVDSMAIPECRGYKTGYEAFRAWIKGLRDNTLFEGANPEDVERRLQVNDYQLLNLLDARHCAAKYLADSIILLEGESAELLSQMADIHWQIYEMLEVFYNKLQQQAGNSISYMEQCLIRSKGTYSNDLRREEADVLGNVLEMEYKSDEIAKRILEKDKKTQGR